MKISPLELKSRVYGMSCHEKVNHCYDGYPYSFHLEMVYLFAKKYIHLLPEQDRENALCACWVHDVIEDARQTYNDVKKATNEDVAEIAFALTNEKGKTRKDRANDKYYEGVRDINAAVFVKICDRLANVKYSKDTGSKMFEAYKKERFEFKKHLCMNKFLPMFTEMYDLFN